MTVVDATERSQVSDNDEDLEPYRDTWSVRRPAPAIASFSPMAVVMPASRQTRSARHAQTMIKTMWHFAGADAEGAVGTRPLILMGHGGGRHKKT